MLEFISKCCTVPVYIIILLALGCVVMYLLVSVVCLLLTKYDNK